MKKYSVFTVIKNHVHCRKCKAEMIPYSAGYAPYFREDEAICRKCYEKYILEEKRAC